MYGCGLTEAWRWTTSFPHCVWNARQCLLADLAMTALFTLIFMLMCASILLPDAAWVYLYIW